MPEMPEVETMTRNLRLWAKGSIIQSVKVHRQNGRYLPGNESDLLIGREIQNIHRIGKQIVFTLYKSPVTSLVSGIGSNVMMVDVLGNNPLHTFLVCHNAMSGFWDTKESPWTFDYVEGKREASDSDVRVEIQAGSITLRFHDARLFGSLRASADPQKDLKLPAAPEAWATECSLEGTQSIGKEQFTQILQSSKHPIKHVLMDQDKILGLGNIYAAEALWHAKIDPRRSAYNLTDIEIGKLYGAIFQTLSNALENKLEYDKYLKVYRRPNCMFCFGKISKVDIKGRNTYFCMNCQK